MHDDSLAPQLEIPVHLKQLRQPRQVGLNQRLQLTVADVAVLTSRSLKGSRRTRNVCAKSASLVTTMRSSASETRLMSASGVALPLGKSLVCRVSKPERARVRARRTGNWASTRNLITQPYKRSSPARVLLRKEAPRRCLPFLNHRSRQESPHSSCPS